MMIRTLMLVSLLIAQPTLAQEGFRSAAERATLLELYTSEGCSSCPPADRWFSGMLDHPDLWQRLIPVAFHVDYWNYLGWEDRFATAEFAERQRDYRRQRITSAVYTPGVMAAGQEWRSWRRHSKQIPFSDERVGVLEFIPEGEGFSARFAPEENVSDTDTLHVAILGFGLTTPVRAGENKGRELRHDFVVLGHDSFSSQNNQWRGQLPAARESEGAEKLAVVAWVSDSNQLGPVQAAGGWWR